MGYYDQIARLHNLHKIWDSNKLANTNLNIPVKYNANDSITVVYVIGESFNRYHTPLYGYPLNTTPRLLELQADSSLIVYNNVITGYNLTCDAYPRLLTTHFIGDESQPHQKPLLPAIFKKANFFVSYYNNQSLFNGDRLDFSSNFLFSSETIRQQCFSNWNEKIYKYDLDMIKDCPIGNAKQSFTIYHLFGQHLPNSDYQDSIFTVKDYQRFKYTNNQERQAVADYDNTTYAVDKLIGYITDKIKDRTAILIFVSDHGERVYDYMHKYGRASEYTPDVVKFVMEQPLFIYVSDKYKAKYPEKVRKLRQTTSKPIYNTDIQHTILDLSGVQTPAMQSELSLLNPIVTRKQRRMPQLGNMIYESFVSQTAKITPVYAHD